MRTRLIAALGLLAAPFLAVPLPSASGAASAPPSAVPNPTVRVLSGGLHGHPFLRARFAPADYGYDEREYAFSGTAKAYGAATAPATYETRMLVYTPKDPARFSGTVYAEWDNQTSQADAPADFLWMYPKVLADGDAYVAMTIQQAGLCGMGLSGEPVAGVAPVCTPVSLVGSDPVRYAGLHHPGDAYAYDILSQALQALKHPKGINPLGPLKPTVLLAVGESQSASKLDDYISNGADAAARLADGFLIDADVGTAEPSSFRVPTLYVWSEDSARNSTVTSGPHWVGWPISGAGHTDYWLVQHLRVLADSLADLPQQSKAAEEAEQQSDGRYQEHGPDASATCAGGSQFPRRYVLDAAAAALDVWARGGATPPTATALTPSGALRPGTLSGTANTGVQWDADDAGNAKGGVRLPVITVPIATYIGNACPLLGTSTPLLDLSTRYPTHAIYVSRMITATAASVKARFMTRRDGIDLVRRACASAIPQFGSTAPADQPAQCRDVAALFPAVAATRPSSPTAHGTAPKPARPSKPTSSVRRPAHGSLAATGLAPLTAFAAMLALGAGLVLARGRGPGR
ncbi:MAG TPA: alpha/beta hydrolase domain-containing protein [Mycobacteriales bacterium]|nr:alpha/beta hydrolase domain-containing protein [Mycobacteriales bacterium]